MRKSRWRQHDLVVGGSGMLRGLCLALAARGHRVTVVGRRAGRLRGLAEEATGGKGAIGPLSVDYRDTAALFRGLEEQIARHGPVALAVCWIHSTAPEAPLAVADALDGQGTRVRYFRLLGSASKPPRDLGGELRARMARLADIAYREVWLGFVRAGGRSRWLTDAEICEGVLAAIQADAPCHVVGTVEPWELRP